VEIFGRNVLHFARCPQTLPTLYAHTFSAIRSSGMFSVSWCVVFVLVLFYPTKHEIITNSQEIKNSLSMAMKDGVIHTLRNNYLLLCLNYLLWVFELVIGILIFYCFMSCV
jgi:hypothetical protein